MQRQPSMKRTPCDIYTRGNRLTQKAEAETGDRDGM
jgi:hypothetical protein